MFTFLVVAHELGSKYVDNLPRIWLACQDADSSFNELRIPVQSLDNWPLGSTFTFTPSVPEEVPNPF